MFTWDSWGIYLGSVCVFKPCNPLSQLSVVLIIRIRAFKSLCFLPFGMMRLWVFLNNWLKLVQDIQNLKYGSLFLAGCFSILPATELVPGDIVEVSGELVMQYLKQTGLFEYLNLEC